jgi:hypothetical protein
VTRHERHESRRKWVILVVAVLLFHAALVVFVRPDYFDFLLRDLQSPSGASSSRASARPDAIIAIQIDVEDADTEIPEDVEVVVTEPETPPGTGDSPRPGDDADAPVEGVDLGDLIGSAGVPREGGGNRRGEVIPPRPLEITWPETRRLKHCIGQHLDVRILVASDGLILRVVPEPSELPEDCRRSAVDAASRIKFAPGKRDGEPVELWTQVRIDFEEKR